MMSQYRGIVKKAYTVRSAYYQLMENIVDNNHLKEQAKVARVKLKTNSSSSNAVTARHTWTKPPVGALKCNIDTSCYAELNIYCIGACVRNDQGKFVRAYTRRLDGKPEIAKAEALGVLAPLQ
ncbi:hypothetical protein L195_g040982, partial [Trifolium pratense]